MKRNAKFKRSMEAVALILPTVLIYTLVIAYPLLNMTYTSFFTWDGIPTSPYIFVDGKIITNSLLILLP